MAVCKVRLSDQTEVAFDPDWVAGGGREKTAFYTPDANRVVLFFKKNLSDRAERIERLHRIIERYNPTTGKAAAYWKAHFCWPEGVIEDAVGLPGGFLQRHGLASPALAVVVPVPKGNAYFRDREGKVRLKSIDWFTGAKTRNRLPEEERGNLAGFVQCCAMLARAVRRLHLDGLAHGDLSSRNVIIDPRDGRACVIDLDALVVPSAAPPTVAGTHGYMAPEVVSGRSKPSIETDLHALAVLIYEILLVRHPLIGPKIRSADPDECDRLELGEDALFIEHPDDSSNHPVPPVLIPFTRLGPHLETLIRRAFIDGLHCPARRPTAGDWEQALYRTVDMLHPTPDGRDYQILGPDLPMVCPFTGKPFTEPVPYASFFRRSPHSRTEFLAEPNRHGLAIYSGLRLLPSHVLTALPGEAQLSPEPQGYFVYDKGAWFFVNESDEKMFVHGTQPLQRKGFVEIKDGLSILMSSAPNARLLRFKFLRPNPPIKSAGLVPCRPAS